MPFAHELFEKKEVRRPWLGSTRNNLSINREPNIVVFQGKEAVYGCASCTLELCILGHYAKMILLRAE
jgi:hypothetical protein